MNGHSDLVDNEDTPIARRKPVDGDPTDILREASEFILCDSSDNQYDAGHLSLLPLLLFVSGTSRLLLFVPTLLSRLASTAQDHPSALEDLVSETADLLLPSIRLSLNLSLYLLEQ